MSSDIEKIELLRRIWQSKFDAIYCIHYLPFKERRARLEKELARVGILDLDIFKWKFTFDNPFDRVSMSNPNLKYTRNNKRFNKGAYNLAMAHYDVMRESLELGHKRILIMEDDVAFLKNLGSIIKIAWNVPKDYDIILFDKVSNNMSEYASYITERLVNNSEGQLTGYAEFDLLWTTACLALSEKGMKHICECQENYLGVADLYTNKYNPGIHQYKSSLEDSLKRCFSVRSLVCQVPNENSINDHGETNSVYNQPGLYDCGMKMELYNV